MKYIYLMANNSGKINLEIYIDMYREWLKLMSHLGTYIKMGFKALESNIDHFLNNRDLMMKHNVIKVSDPEYIYITDFCLLEISLGIEAMNEDTNKDIMNGILKNKKNKDKRFKENMRDDFKKYQSTTRTLLRGAWFFDYTKYLFRKFYDDREISTSENARSSYDDCGLSARHPWYVSTPAKWAMGLINSREDFN